MGSFLHGIYAMGHFSFLLPAQMYHKVQPDFTAQPRVLGAKVWTHTVWTLIPSPRWPQNPPPPPPTRLYKTHHAHACGGGCGGGRGWGGGGGGGDAGLRMIPAPVCVPAGTM